MVNGEPILKRMSREAADTMCGFIRDAGGNEVFCAGTMDDAGILVAIRILARGNAKAVPALFSMLDTREVVLHNHPSGDLTPSDADLELATLYSAHGHGVYIVDNEVTHCYVVVEAFLPKPIIPLAVDELKDAFTETGALAEHLDGFELRPQQLAMTECIAAAFNSDSLALVEAPTGVGKTMAYLLPAVLWSRRNKERIVISTRTINLQEQIIHHDLPLLKACIKEDFEACLVKGRSNYLCLHKLARAFSEISLFEDERTAEQIRAIAAWAETTEDGSQADLPFMASRSVWEKVCCEPDVCLGAACTHFRECFFMRARRVMATADILVANHHLVFADIAVKRETGDFSATAVLPSYSRLIFDEAHSIEDAATEYFGISATRIGMRKTMRKLYRRDSDLERGLLPFLKLKLMRNCTTVSVEDYNDFLVLIEERLQPIILMTEDALDQAFHVLRVYTTTHCGRVGTEIQWRLTEEVLSEPELRSLHEEEILPAIEHVGALLHHGRKLVEKLEEIRPEPGEELPVLLELTELKAYLRQIETIAKALEECTKEELEDNTVRWIELHSRDEDRVRVARCPLEVGQPLSEWLYKKMSSVIMTSATLTVRRSFDYCKSRIGLNLLPEERVKELLLDSPFDYKDQTLMCIPTDGPLPGEEDYLENQVETIRSILRITQGHALVLFTSFYAMDFVYDRLEIELAERGIESLCQGKDSRTRLLTAFRDNASSVLFATDSFWEGVDVAGESLQCVVLTRLPFRVPTEPILEARSEAIEKEGGNAFMNFQVPQAVIKLRQGFGRLIRRKTDWGVIVVLDKRIVTKYYGRAFMTSLPPLPVVRGSNESVWTALETFFKKKREN